MSRLSTATSPYLRQHAENPVDWYPWGDEALARARAEDKPLFVSIGYAACHWCHVMAHESFEDPTIAESLARSFVAVKVDREERPDVDAVYMAATQALTGSGGWPMSVFCTPDGRPFFAGTYFPARDTHGLPSFRRVVDAVRSAWLERRAEVEEQATALAAAVEHDVRALDRLALAAPRPADEAPGTDQPPAGAPPAGAILSRAVDDLGARFDARSGGFGPAPKFPRPTLVELCLRHHLRTGDDRALEMATVTLDAMAAGGIYDHLEGGFARYSTDARWLVPHFEKMLTDQALLARAYLRAWQATGEARYRQVATETLDAACDTMRVPTGGFCSSIDADAAGVEGGHATWTRDEVVAVLRDAGLEGSADEACAWYGIGDAAAGLDGRFVLHRPRGGPLERPPAIDAVRDALRRARRRRPQPERDTKVLTEWNAMLVATLAQAAAACDDARWARQAEDTAEMLFARCRRADGRWLRAAGGSVPAFAADHAWVALCCLDLGELTGEARWTRRAEELVAALVENFWDDAGAGFFTAGHDAERLVARSKDVVDGAVPSSNASAAQALVRLGALTGDERVTGLGERLIELVGPLLAAQPTMVADMVPACALADEGAQIVIAGTRPDLLATVRAHWLPNAVVSWGEPSSAALWAGREPGAAYVCKGFVCGRPATDTAALEEQLVPLSRWTPRSAPRPSIGSVRADAARTGRAGPTGPPALPTPGGPAHTGGPAGRSRR